MDTRIYQCPALPTQSCDWEGSAEELPLHFEASHPKLRINRVPQRYFDYYGIRIHGEIDVKTETEQNLLLIYPTDTFLLQLKVDFPIKKLWVGVRYVGNAEDGQQFQYHMIISNEHSDRIQKKGSMQLDNDWNFDAKSMLEFDLSAVIKIIESFKFCFRIEMVTNLFMKELKCLVCRNNIVDFPVLGCQARHIICSRCKRGDACQLCGLTVQDLTSLVLHPCKNALFGCNIQVKKGNVHERNCYGMKSCFIEDGCNFVGIAYKWWHHLLEKHPQVTHVTNQERYYDLKKSYFEHIFLRLFGVIFRILCERKDHEDSFVWSCQQVGLKPGEERQFKLEVNVVDPHNANLISVGSAPCCSLAKPEDKATESVTVELEVLRHYIVSNKIGIRYYLSRF